MQFATLFKRFLGLEERSPLPVPDTKTIVSIAYVTPSITFNGPYVLVTMTPGNTLASLLATSTQKAATSTTRRPAIASLPTTSASSDDDSSTDSSAQSTTSNSNDSQTTSDQIAQTSATNTIAALPTTTQGASSITPGLNQVSAASATATPTDVQKGMSGGAVAGLIFGLLLGIGAIVVGVIMLYRRKKQEQGSHARLDDEKNFTSRPDALPFNPTPAMTQVVQSPQFSQRSATQASPNMGHNSSNGFQFGTPAAAAAGAGAGVGLGLAAAAAARSNTASPVPSMAPSHMSAWERPGSNHVNDPANPFGNHAELSTTPPKSTLSVNTAAAPVPAPTAGAVELHSDHLPSPVEPASFPLPQSGPSTPVPPTIASPATPVATSPVPTALVAGGAAAAAGAVAAAAAAKQPENKVHRVQMDFVPSMDDELAIRTGQLIKIQHEYDDGWALVGYMDGSKSGVVPRTCLSKNALKPRPQNGPPGRPGQGPMTPVRPNGAPRPMTPQGRNSPAPFAQAPRPLTPTGRGPSNPSAPPFAQVPRPASASPAGRQRAASNAGPAPYIAYVPNGQPQNRAVSQPRSMSPGPYGAAGLKPSARPENTRRRSQSVSMIDTNKAVAGSPPAVLSPLGQMPARKPVGGMASPPAPTS